MHTICRIPSGSPVQYVTCNWHWFPLPPGDYYGWHGAAQPEWTYLCRCDDVAARKPHTVHTADVQQYAVELVEKPDPPPIGIHARDTVLLQAALRIAAQRSGGGTPEDDLAWILKRFVVAYSQEVAP